MKAMRRPFTSISACRQGNNGFSQSGLSSIEPPISTELT
jgi:hypothetical protein